MAAGPASHRSLPPRAWHLVEAVNWPSVQRHGLRSTRDLLRLCRAPAARRREILAEQRRALTPLSPAIAVRDQLPMPPGALARCLVGMTPAQWYERLNGFVFFWLDRARLERQLGACRGRPQVVLTLDTAGLLARHADAAFVTPFNSGNARRRPATRGAATFVPYREWRAFAWRAESAGLGTRERPRSHAPVELVIAGAVPDAMEFVVDAAPVRPAPRRLRGAIRPDAAGGVCARDLC